MRVALILAVIVAVAAASSVAAQQLKDTDVLASKDLADRLNTMEASTWQATHKPGIRIAGATVAQVKRLMGAKKSATGRSLLPKRVFSDDELAATIPDSFDAAVQWPQCPTITHIRDQSECGSCWAVASAEAMSDRFCVKGGPKNLNLSAATIMDCCWFCGGGCNGGDAGQAFAYMQSTGTFDTACQPYPFPKCEHHIPKNHYPVCPKQQYTTPSCKSTCYGNGTATRYKGASAYNLQGVSAYQTELMANGPFAVSFNVYSDFPLYKSGVYEHKTEQVLGGHVVKIVGWGSLGGVKYWKIANSWNRDWGMGGYFLIKRGTNECNIEAGGAGGLPKL